MRMLPTLTGMTFVVAASASAQARFELSVPQIMRGVENTGREPSQVRWGPDEPQRPEGQPGFVEREGLALLRAVRDRKWRDSVDKAERAARGAGRPRPFYLAQGEQVAGLDPSPAGNAVLVRLLTPPKDSR